LSVNLCPQAADLYDASIVVDNAATVQSPFAITVKPGVPDKTQCSVVGKTTFEAGLVKLALNVKDKYGNLVPGKGVNENKHSTDIESPPKPLPPPP
jgi:hypothetical protein